MLHQQTRECPNITQLLYRAVSANEPEMDPNVTEESLRWIPSAKGPRKGSEMNRMKKETTVGDGSDT